METKDKCLSVLVCGVVHKHVGRLHYFAHIRYQLHCAAKLKVVLSSSCMADGCRVCNVELPIEVRLKSTSKNEDESSACRLVSRIRPVTKTLVV